MKLAWHPLATADRVRIMDYIAQDNPAAALELDLDFEAKAELAQEHPKLYKPGRVKGTREIVARMNYVMVYAIKGDTITILRVLHAAQQWP